MYNFVDEEFDCHPRTCTTISDCDRSENCVEGQCIDLNCDNTDQDCSWRVCDDDEEWITSCPAEQTCVYRELTRALECIVLSCDECEEGFYC